MSDHCDYNVSKAISKGRDIAKKICTNSNLYSKINDTITKFLQFIYKLISQYADYLYDNQLNEYKSFFEYKIQQYTEEIEKDFKMKMKTSDFRKRQSLTNQENLIYTEIKNNPKKIFRIIMLLDNLMPNEKSNEHTKTVHSQKGGQCGQNIRSWENLTRIINNEDTVDPVNIREKLSMIYNFRFSCALMWDIIKIYYENNPKWITYFSECFDVNNFKRNLEKMSKYLEIDMKDAVKVCQKLLIDTTLTKSKGNAAIERQIATLSKCFQSSPGTTLSLCALVYLPVSGSVLVSRVCPEGKCRDTAQNCNNRQVTIRDVFPQLSQHEKDFMKRFDSFDIDFSNKSTRLRWLSGRYCCDPVKESFFYTFYNNYGKPMITGPSGTMDMFMIFANYFPLTLYEKQLIVLGIVAWMAVPPDHSIFEMLSVLPANGIIDFKPFECEYNYVTEMSKHLNTYDYPFSKNNLKEKLPNQQYCNSDSDSESQNVIHIGNRRVSQTNTPPYSNSDSNSSDNSRFGGKPLYIKKLKPNYIGKNKK